MKQLVRTAASLVALTLATSLQAAEASPKTGQDEKEAAAAKALPKLVDLRPRLEEWGLQPRCQGSRRTCAVCVTTGALEFALATYLNRGTALSVEYLNWACNTVVHNRTKDRGHFFHDLLSAFEEYGICFEADMPYQKQFNPRLRPSATAYQRAGQIQALDFKVHWINPRTDEGGLTDQQLNQIKEVLARGWPVAVGSNHTWLLVGYQENPAQPGGGVFIANDPGAAAYILLTYQYVQEKVADAYWIESPARLAAKDR